MLASAMPDLGIAAVMSYSWDRFIVDPSPGPRARADFDGLIDRGGVAQIPPSAALRIGQSTLPRLAGAIDLPLLLVEADGGAVGLSALIARAATAFGADQIVVVDVGGDILAEGHEASLRTPLADSLALAAAVRTGIATRVLVAGIGMDGELSAAEVDERLGQLHAQQLADLTPRDAVPFEGIWAWHPSEANALLAAAAAGWRGTVECQRNAAVELTGASTGVFEVGAQQLVDASLAAVLTDTTSLAEAEQLLRDRRAGRSELDVERQRAAGDRAKVRMPGLEALAVIDEYATDARERGVTALTVRRVAEMVSAFAPEATDALRTLLTEQRPHNFRPPLYSVS